MKIAATRKPGLVSKPGATRNIVAKPGGARTTMPPKPIRGLEQAQGLQQVHPQLDLVLGKCHISFVKM